MVTISINDCFKYLLKDTKGKWYICKSKHVFGFQRHVLIPKHVRGTTALQLVFAEQVIHEVDYADGFMLNICFNELWRFKTPFHAWFSRNFESLVLPLLWLWGFTHGHVSWAVLTTQALTGDKPCYNLDYVWTFSFEQRQ